MLKWSPVPEIKVRSLHLPSSLVSGKSEENEGEMVAAFDKASLILAAILKIQTVKFKAWTPNK